MTQPEVGSDVSVQFGLKDLNAVRAAALCGVHCDVGAFKNLTRRDAVFPERDSNTCMNRDIFTLYSHRGADAGENPASRLLCLLRAVEIIR